MPPKVRAKGNSRARWVAIGAATCGISPPVESLSALIPAVPGTCRFGRPFRFVRRVPWSEPMSQMEAISADSRLRSLALASFPRQRARQRTDGERQKRRTGTREDRLYPIAGPAEQRVDGFSRACTKRSAAPGIGSARKNSVCAFQWKTEIPHWSSMGETTVHLAQSLASVARRPWKNFAENCLIARAQNYAARQDKDPPARVVLEGG